MRMLAPEALVLGKRSFLSSVTSPEDAVMVWAPSAPGEVSLASLGLGVCTEASGGARAKPGSQAAPGSYGPSDAGPSPLLGAAVPVQGPGPGQCGPSAPRGHPHIMPVLVILTTDTSSASEDEGSLRRPVRLASTPLQSHPSVQPWLGQAGQGSSTSSSASSTSSHPGGSPAAALAGPAALAHIGQ